MRNVIAVIRQLNNRNIRAFDASATAIIAFVGGFFLFKVRKWH